jgi:hypothetical protein
MLANGRHDAGMAILRALRIENIVTAARWALLRAVTLENIVTAARRSQQYPQLARIP